ncbi:MAG: hypothetical protein ACI4EG_00575 [Fusicatenibacter sp.]
MNWDFNEIENDIEQQETNIEQIEKDQEQLETRDSALKESIQKVAQDAQIAASLAEHVHENEREMQENKQRIEEAQTQIYDLQFELQQQMDEINEERSTLEMLKSIGEDVSEAEAILNDRETILHEANDRLQELADRLGISLSALEQKITAPVTQAAEHAEQHAEESTDQLIVPESAEHIAVQNSTTGLNLQMLKQTLIQKITSHPGLNEEQKKSLLDAAARNDTVNDPARSSDKKSWKPVVPNSVFAQGADDRMPGLQSETITEKTERYGLLLNNLDNDYPLIKDPVGKQIVAQLMSSDVTQFQKEVQEQLPPLLLPKTKEADQLLKQMQICQDDLKFMELARKRSKLLDEIQTANNTLKTLENYQARLQNYMGKDRKPYTLVTPDGKGIFDSYQQLIRAQGVAYPNLVINNCGVCTMVNLANQQGASYTEKSGLAMGYGNYSHEKTATGSGWTSLDQQKNILSALGFQGEMKYSGLSFDELTKEITAGHSVSINCFSKDLPEGDKIAPRSNKIFSNSKLRPAKANHAVTVAGLVKDSNGNYTGVLINDTGRAGGIHDSILYLSKDKYEDMRNNTLGFSSIVCTGRRTQ